MTTRRTKDGRRLMVQSAPYPGVLEYLVNTVRYKSGWDFRLVENLDRGAGSSGLTLVVTTRWEDGRRRHLFPVPFVRYSSASWTRWLLNQIIKAETRAAMESYRYPYPSGAEYWPFRPSGELGEDPYAIQYRTWPDTGETVNQPGPEEEL